MIPTIIFHRKKLPCPRRCHAGSAAGRPAVIVWHHPVPKSRGGRDVVPMQSICQQTLIAYCTNSELQRHGTEVACLLDHPNVRKFVDWVAKKDPDFTVTITKKQR